MLFTFIPNAGYLIAGVSLQQMLGYFLQNDIEFKGLRIAGRFCLLLESPCLVLRISGQVVNRFVYNSARDRIADVHSNYS